MEQQHKKMLDDIDKYGDMQNGTYRNIEWSMKRPYGTYWCAYVHYNGELNDDQIEQLENLSHMGLTSGIGFDCAHYGDYAPMKLNDKFYQSLCNQDDTYKDHDYVRNIVKTMIDYIADNRGFD
jgi:hypothetical protein